MFLAFALGVGLLTPVLVLSAAFGLFRPVGVGGAGWIIALFGHVACRRRDTLRTASVRSVEMAVLAAALVFFIVSMNGRDETIGAGRDQQVYAELS